MRTIGYGLAVGAIVLGWLAAACGDTVRTHDGRTFQGRVVSEPNAATVEVETELGRIALAVSEVAGIDYGTTSPAGPKAEAAPNAPGGGRAAPVDAGGGNSPGVDERQLLAEPLAESERALTAAEGAAIWKQFLAEHASGRPADLARERLAVWQDRVDRDLVRFGPTWLARGEADRRNARADELLAQAEAQKDLEDAGKLYDEAAAAQPFRADIPFAKARRLIRAKKYPEACTALEQARTVQPDHVAALNNLGVLAAAQKNWPVAFLQLGRAAGADNPAALDNLAEAMFLAWEAGSPRQALAAVERKVEQIVAELHRGGKHVGQARWGSAWIEQARYEQIRKDNAVVDAQLAERQARFALAEKKQSEADAALLSLQRDFLRRFGRRGAGPAGRDVRGQFAAADDQARQARQEADKLRKEIDELRAKRTNAPHPGRLILIDLDARTELASLSAPPGTPPQ